MNINPATKVDIAVASANRGAGTTDVNGVVMDMAGYEGIRALIEWGAITAGAVTSVKWQQGDQSNGSDMADVPNSSQTIAANYDDKVTLSALEKPVKRYVRCVIDRGTQNAALRSALYERHTPRVKPTTYSASDDVADAKTTIGS